MFNYSHKRLLSLIMIFVFSMAVLVSCSSGGGEGTSNTAPTATIVTIVDDNGGVALVGDNLTGSYTYNDVDGDLEGTSTFSWLSNGMAISNATSLTYILVADDSGQDITFEVTPVAATGTATGTAVTSTVLLIGNSAPVATNVTLVDSNGGDAAVGDELVGSYSYSDEDADIEGTSTFRWLRDGFAIDGATTSTYTIVTADGSATITFEATPVATTGTITGLAVTSSGILAIHYPEFITTWKTDNTGITGDYDILITTNNTGGDYSVDWGDGVVQHNLSGDVFHPYISTGTYTVKISGDFPGIYFDNGDDNPKLLSVENWGDISWTTMRQAFLGCSNLVSINAKDVPDLSNVTDISFMFSNASSFNSDISAWDTSTVTNMSDIFGGASAFNGDISAWDTSAVTNMDSMFNGAIAFNSDISAWDTSAVTNMNSMFKSAFAFDQDIGDWNTTKVTSMSEMFAYNTAFNGDISTWNTSMVTDMNSMFFGASAFTNHDLSGWDVSSSPTHAGFLIDAGAGNIEPIW